MKKHLGFMDYDLARSKSGKGNFSIEPFKYDCIAHYTLWQRLRLALLLLLKCNICDLHVPLSPKCEWSSPEWCQNWVKETRCPELLRALEIAASLRSDMPNQGSEPARDSGGPADSD